MDALMDAMASRSRQVPLEDTPPSQQNISDRVNLDLRVLLAEDNPANIEVASALLEDLGCWVYVARNGLEALRALDLHSYDLILMDCQMPSISGYEATRRIRQRNDDCRTIPIVALTAHALAGDRDQCLAAGMNDYLSKPIDRGQLREALEKWCNDSLRRAANQTS